METPEILSEALKKSPEDRAELARRLLESLDVLTEADAEALWIDEAERRAGEMERGSVIPVSSNELERRIQSRLR